jgi:hypothetical protein
VASPSSALCRDDLTESEDDCFFPRRMPLPDGCRHAAFRFGWDRYCGSCRACPSRLNDHRCSANFYIAMVRVAMQATARTEGEASTSGV